MKNKKINIEFSFPNTLIQLKAQYDELNDCYVYSAFDKAYYWCDAEEITVDVLELENYIKKDATEYFEKLAIMKIDDKPVVFQNEHHIWFDSGVYDLSDKSVENRMIDLMDKSLNYSFTTQELQKHFFVGERDNKEINAINIYDVDRSYLEYLKRKDIQKRGFSTVPNYGYEDIGRERKFASGPVFEINGQHYFVFASHKTILNDDVTPIFFEREPGTIKGTLRYQYMIPVPKSALIHRNINNEIEPSRKAFLFQYLNSIKQSEKEILQKAENVYLKRVSGKLPEFLLDRFNDFKFLESKMIQYELNQKLGLENENEIEVDYDEKSESFVLVYESSYRRKIETYMIEDINVMAHFVEEDMDYLVYIHEKGSELLRQYEDDLEL